MSNLGRICNWLTLLVEQCGIDGHSVICNNRTLDLIPLGLFLEDALHFVGHLIVGHIMNQLVDSYLAQVGNVELRCNTDLQACLEFAVFPFHVEELCFTHRFVVGYNVVFVDVEHEFTGFLDFDILAETLTNDVERHVAGTKTGQIKLGAEFAEGFVDRKG